MHGASVHEVRPEGGDSTGGAHLQARQDESLIGVADQEVCGGLQRLPAYDVRDGRLLQFTGGMQQCFLTERLWRKIVISVSLSVDAQCSFQVTKIIHIKIEYRILLYCYYINNYVYAL